MPPGHRSRPHTRPPRAQVHHQRRRVATRRATHGHHCAHYIPYKPLAFTKHCLLTDLARGREQDHRHRMHRTRVRTRARTRTRTRTIRHMVTPAWCHHVIVHLAVDLRLSDHQHLVQIRRHGVGARNRTAQVRPYVHSRQQRQVRRQRQAQQHQVHSLMLTCHQVQAVPQAARAMHECRRGYRESPLWYHFSQPPTLRLVSPNRLLAHPVEKMPRFARVRKNACQYHFVHSMTILSPSDLTKNFFVFFTTT